MKRLIKFKFILLIFLLFVMVGCASATTIKVFGDSYSDNEVHGNETDYYHKWHQLIGTNQSYTVNTGAYSGAQIQEQITTNIRSYSTSTDIPVYWLTGPNDVLVYKTNISGLETYNESLQSNLVWLALPSANKTNGKNCTTLSGSWLKTDVYSTNGVRASTPGYCLKKDVYGDTVYIGSISIQATGVALLDLYLDGNKITTWSCRGGSTSRFNIAYHPTLIRVSNLENTLHNVTIVVNSTTTGDSYVEYIAGIDSNTISPNKIYLINCPPFTTTYYNSLSTNINATNELNLRVNKTVSMLNDDGLNISLIDVSTGYDPATMMSVDGLHPNNLGHSFIFNRWYQYSYFNNSESIFTANKVSGVAPLTIKYTDISNGYPSMWYWDFENDGIIDSTKQNPVHTYGKAGNYTVNLTVTNEYGNFSTVKTDYITVTAQPSPSTLSELYWWLVGYLGLSVSYQAVVS